MSRATRSTLQRPAVTLQAMPVQLLRHPVHHRAFRAGEHLRHGGLARQTWDLSVAARDTRIGVDWPADDAKACAQWLLDAQGKG